MLRETAGLKSAQGKDENLSFSSLQSLVPSSYFPARHYEREYTNLNRKAISSHSARARATLTRSVLRRSRMKVDLLTQHSVLSSYTLRSVSLSRFRSFDGIALRANPFCLSLHQKRKIKWNLPKKVKRYSQKR